MKKMMMAAIVAAFVLSAPSAFAIPIGYCIGKSDGNYYQEYRNVPGGDAIKCQGGKTFNACEGNDGKGFRPKGGDFVGICKGGSLTSDTFHYGKRLCVPPECTSPTWLPEADGRAVPPSGGGSSGGGSSGGGSSGGSSSGGSSSGGGTLEIVDIGDSKPPKKQDGQNGGGKNGQNQEGEIGPVGGWEKEPEKKAPKGKFYNVKFGCYNEQDCAIDNYAEDLNDACKGSASGGKNLAAGFSYRLFVRNGVCYYEASNKGKKVGEYSLQAKLVSSDKVPEDKKPKDEKKKDEKPKDDKGKECLDNNPHICKGKDGKWKDTREEGNGCVSGALEQRATNPCEAFIACRRRAVPSEARRIGSMKLTDGLYAETSPFCFGIFAEEIPFRDKSEKNGGIKAV